MPDSTLSTTAKPTWQQRLLFGQEPSPELAAILLVYFVQGILGLSRLAVSFFLKDDLGLSPAQVSALTGIAALPWMIKPAFGLLSDGFPLWGYRRRPYLIAAGLLGSLAWLGLGTIVQSPAMATLAIGLSSLSVALSDVIVDSLVVERARQESRSESGSLQSLTWAVSALGGLVTAYLSGFLLQLFETCTLFLITASFPLIICFVAGWIVEQPQSIQPGVALIREQIGQISQALRQRQIWMPTLFLFLWQVTPSADSAFFFFTTNELHFEPEFLGRVRLVTNLASLLGVWIFQRFLRGVPIRRIFGWMIAVTTLLGLTSLILVTHLNRSWGISDQWFSLGDSLILTVAGQLSFMPVLILAARLCPSGIEATLFALLMSVLNLAHFGSVELGALLTHWLGVTESQFDRLWLLVLLTNLSSLLPLPFVGLLPAEEPPPATSEAIATATPEPLVVTQ